MIVANSNLAFEFRTLEHIDIHVYIHTHTHTYTRTHKHTYNRLCNLRERWGAGVETQKNVRGEIGGWGRVSFHENYAPSLSTIYDGA